MRVGSLPDDAPNAFEARKILVTVIIVLAAAIIALCTVTLLKAQEEYANIDAQAAAQLDGALGQHGYRPLANKLIMENACVGRSVWYPFSGVTEEECVLPPVSAPAGC